MHDASPFSMPNNILLKRLFLFMWVCIGSLTAYGQTCSCESPATPQAAIDGADIVFSGRVIQVTTNWMSGGMKFTFEVEECWKNRVDRYFFVNSGWESKDCGYLFEEGKEYLVFVHKKFTAKTDRCSGNQLLDAATEALAELGPGQPPSQSPNLPGMYLTLVIMGIASLLFVAFIVLRKRIFAPKTP